MMVSLARAPNTRPGDFKSPFLPATIFLQVHDQRTCDKLVCNAPVLETWPSGKPGARGDMQRSCVPHKEEIHAH